MKKAEALVEFEKEHKDLIERKLKENLIDDITTVWNDYTNKLLLEERISDKKYIAWDTPNFETKSFVQTKISEGAIAIKEAMQRGKNKAVVMHVQPCKLHKAFNPLKPRVCTYELLSPGAKEVYNHFQAEGYTMTIHATHDGGGIKEWFNLTATW
ncbi:hypothetical protein CN918_29235 [Priestia megaterium]|nr:hypothetical protein CN918_29235 [Priestia megaterium]